MSHDCENGGQFQSQGRVLSGRSVVCLRDSGTPRRPGRCSDERVRSRKKQAGPGRGLRHVRDFPGSSQEAGLRGGGHPPRFYKPTASALVGTSRTHCLGCSVPSLGNVQAWPLCCPLSLVATERCPPFQVWQVRRWPWAAALARVISTCSWTWTVFPGAAVSRQAGEEAGRWSEAWVAREVWWTWAG